MIAGFIKSRRLLAIAALAVAIELTLPLWAGRAYVVAHEGYLRAVPLAVPAQFLVVALLLYTASSGFARMDRLAARRMPVCQLIAWAASAAPVVAAALSSAAIMGDTGTIGALAPLKALLGLWGAGLLAAAAVDRRVAGVVPVLPLLLPMVSPAAVPGIELWGFAMEPDESAPAWAVAAGLLCLGVVAHARWSEGFRR